MKNRIFKILGLTAILTVALAVDAFASSGVNGGGSGTVVGNAIKKAAHVFQSVRTIVFVIGGFGLVGLAVQAIFGKVKWPWFGALAVGLGVLAAAGAIISYATGDNVTSTSGTGGYNDTFSTDQTSHESINW